MASSSSSSHIQIHYNCSGCSGTLTGMLGDEQRNQTLAYTGLETLRPYFRLLHASCSHFLFFVLSSLLPSLPARFLSTSSEPWLCSFLLPLMSPVLFLQRSQGSALAGGLSCYNPCCSSFISPSLSRFLLSACLSFLSSPSSTISHTFLFLRSTLSPCCTYSSAQFISHPPPFCSSKFQFLSSAHVVNI